MLEVQPAFSYTAEHPNNVTKLVIMDFPYPGFLPPSLRSEMGLGGFLFIKHVTYQKLSYKVKSENMFHGSMRGLAYNPVCNNGSKTLMYGQATLSAPRCDYVDRLSIIRAFRY